MLVTGLAMATYDRAGRLCSEVWFGIGICVADEEIENVNVAYLQSSLARSVEICFIVSQLK